MSPWNVHRFFFGGGRLSLWGAWILFAPPPILKYTVFLPVLSKFSSIEICFPTKLETRNTVVISVLW